MNHFKVTYREDGEPRTVLIEAETIEDATTNATGVLTYDHGPYDDAVDITEISVSPALEGEEDEYDHIHRDVAEMERIMAEVSEQMAAKARDGQERLTTLTEAARTHLAAMRESEHESGWASPEDGDPIMELRTAKEAFKAGIATDSWECVAEGLVMLEHAIERATMTGDGRFGTGKAMRR